MASILSQLIVSLVDQVTGPAKQVGAAFDGMSRRIKEASGTLTFTDKLDAQMTRTNRQLAQARGQLVDAVAGFYALKTALGAPIGNAMETESVMSGIASKAGLSAEKTSELRGALRDASKATNQHTIELAKAVDRLVGMGMSADDAVTAINDIGAASTATGANVTEMADAGFAAISNLKVPADDLMSALDAMAMAGKRGGFELKDMASYFPNIGSAYAALGQTGTGAVADLAAAMQIMRKNTGDASSAATNLQNVIQKMQSPATVNAFKKMGVNLEAELKAAAEAGLTPLEAIAEITAKTLKGDLSRIGYLFEDSQAQAGIRSLIQNMEEFRSIRAEAMGADGTNMADFNRAMATTAEQVKSAQIAFSNLSETIGNSLLPAVKEIAGAVTPIVEGFTKLAENNPALVAGLALTAGGFIALRTAMAGLTFLGLMGKAGALTALKVAVTGLGGAFAGIKGSAYEMIRLQGALAKMDGKTLGALDKIVAAARGMALAAPGASGFVSGLSGLGGLLATISAPAWGTFALAAAAIGAAGWAIWRYWDRISSVMSGVGAAIGDLLAPALEKVKPYLEWLKPIGNVIASGWERAKSAMSSVASWLGSIFQQETLTEADKEKARQAGYDFVMSLWNGMKAVFNDLVSWVSGKVDEITAPVRNLANSVSGFFGGGEAAPSGPIMAPINGSETNSLDGQRAKGGPISRGGRYLVGERGPELITAGRSGYVNRAGTGGAGGITVSPVFNMTFNGKTDSEDVVQQIRRVLRDEVRETFRGVFADTSMRFA